MEAAPKRRCAAFFTAKFIIKNKNQAGQKRTAGKNNAQGAKKDEPEQKKSRPLEEPNPHDNSYEIKDEVPSEEMASEEAEKTTAPEEAAAPADEEGIILTQVVVHFNPCG